jgi:hypothetical protein
MLLRQGIQQRVLQTGQSQVILIEGRQERVLPADGLRREADRLRNQALQGE